MRESGFWGQMEELVAGSIVVIDRPRGSAHPRYAELVYPLDYGYLEGSTSGDRGGIDVWVGSLPQKRVTGVVCTTDVGKRDAEVKVLLGCTREEMLKVYDFHAENGQGALLVVREREGREGVRE